MEDGIIVPSKKGWNQRRPLCQLLKFDLRMKAHEQGLPFLWFRRKVLPLMLSFNRSRPLTRAGKSWSFSGPANTYTSSNYNRMYTAGGEQ
ncbi:hypothetical protein J5N97_020187 [Dioscorea zingiberensis]|uniref:Uncharacterized protein n=1 Tax=Dioscorea zingiberensis TaxID=325984 RepID=A0A9D5HDK4_9LILI|nr:hypothetical protein J5N97_020187 [Dioscorea zingiberensis]